MTGNAPVFQGGAAAWLTWHLSRRLGLDGRQDLYSESLGLQRYDAGTWRALASLPCLTAAYRDIVVACRSFVRMFLVASALSTFVEKNAQDGEARASPCAWRWGEPCTTGRLPRALVAVVDDVCVCLVGAFFVGTKAWLCLPSRRGYVSLSGMGHEGTVLRTTSRLLAVVLRRQVREGLCRSTTLQQQIGIRHRHPSLRVCGAVTGTFASPSR